MKIKTIMCNSSKEFYDAHAGRRLAMSTAEVQLVVVNIPHGPDSMESAYDEAIAAPYILQQVVSAETEGCDAVVIDCAADPALRAAREISELPVVSAGEASYHAAMMVAGKFSVITVLPTTANEISDHLKMYGFPAALHPSVQPTYRCLHWRTSRKLRSICMLRQGKPSMKMARRRLFSAVRV